MNRLFRKYHRSLALILAVPLFVTVLTGMANTIIGDWFKQETLAYEVLRWHTGEVFHLEAIYPLLNGLGLIGLLVTGISMSGILRRSRV